MNPQILMPCQDGLSWTKCAASAALAFLVELVRTESDPAYWLLLALYCLDFFLAIGIAVLAGTFCLEKFALGLKKLVGYLFLLLPLLLAGRYLQDAAQQQVYELSKNWCLFYMCVIEGGSIGRHLQELGVPVPSPKKLKEFVQSISKMTGDKRG